MPADLDQLLHDVVPDPEPIDVDALWAAGRRRRLARRVAMASTALVTVAFVTVGAVSLAGGLGINQVEIEPMVPVEDVDEMEEPVEEPEATVEDEPDLPEPIEPEPEQTVVEDEAPEDSETIVDEESSPASDPAPVPTPEPDPAAVERPCAAHEGREGEAFVAVVAPVAGQHVSGVVELVGCSNVYEATVRYRLTDASGGVLADSFTTAVCGSGCVGEFRETIAVEATGKLELVVFWEDANDGSERDTVVIAMQSD